MTSQNGANRLIYTEKRFKLVSLVFFFLLLFSSSIVLALLFTKKIYISIILDNKETLTVPWWFYILPFFYIIYSIIQIILLSNDISTFKKARAVILNENQNGNFTPLIFLKIYRNLLKKQVINFWISFSCLFYLSIFCSIFYGFLTTKNQWLTQKIDMDKSFVEPRMFLWFLVSILILIFISFLLKSIALKLRRTNYELFFSISSVDYLEILRLNSTTNKFAFKIFLWSFLILIVFPVAFFILIWKRTTKLRPK